MKKSRKSKIIKQFLFASSVLVILLTFCIGAFADSSEIVPFFNIIENRPNATTQGEIYFTTSVSNQTWSAQIARKDTGVIGVRIDYDDNRVSAPYDIIRTQFDYTGWDNNARVNFTAGYGEFMRSDQLWSPVSFIGFTIRLNPWLVGGDTEPQGIILDCYRTYGYTLDYPSNERYYLSFDDVVKVDYDGINTAVRLNMFIDTNTTLGTTTLYLNTNSGALKIDTINTYIIDPYIMQWGMFDPIQIDTDLEPFAIRNVQKYVVDNGYTEGFNDGYKEGIDDGKDLGFEEGKAEGKYEEYRRVVEEIKPTWESEAFDEGYLKGKLESGSVLDVPAVVDSVFQGVGHIFKGFDLNIFGISIAGLLVSILVAVIVLYIVKKVK